MIVPSGSTDSVSTALNSPIQRILLLTALMLLSVILSACNQRQEAAGPQYGDVPQEKAPLQTYHVAVHPLHNPARLTEAYQPLIDYLNKRLPDIRLNLESSRDYASFEQKYRSRTPEFILPNPWQTLQAIKSGYRVIAIAGESQDFKGIFVVRKDSGIKRANDLKGKTVSYPSPTALAACIMPQWYLHRQGISISRDIENRYVGSQESSIMNVYLGQSAAGATWPPPWRAFQKAHPEEAAKLKVIWETESLINNSFMVRDDLPSELRKRVLDLLLELPKSEEGRAILQGMETARFITATNADYDLVRSYVARFEQEVRPVEQR